MGSGKRNGTRYLKKNFHVVLYATILWHFGGITARIAGQEWRMIMSRVMYNNSAAELNRLRLSLEEEMEIVKHIMEEAKKSVCGMPGI